MVRYAETPKARKQRGGPRSHFWREEMLEIKPQVAEWGDRGKGSGNKIELKTVYQFVHFASS